MVLNCKKSLNKMNLIEKIIDLWRSMIWKLRLRTSRQFKLKTIN